MQFSGTLSAKPNQNFGGIDPKEGSYLAGDSDCVVTRESLQRLDKKCSVVRITVGSFLVMYALSFQKELFFHGGQPFSRAAPREHKSIGGNLDSSGSCSLRRNGAGEVRKL